MLHGSIVKSTEQLYLKKSSSFAFPLPSIRNHFFSFMIYPSLSIFINKYVTYIKASPCFLYTLSPPLWSYLFLFLPAYLWESFQKFCGLLKQHIHHLAETAKLLSAGVVPHCVPSSKVWQGRQPHSLAHYLSNFWIFADLILAWL